MRHEDNAAALLGRDEPLVLPAVVVALVEREAARAGVSPSEWLRRAAWAYRTPMTPAEKQRAYRNRQREAGMRTVGALPGAAVAQAAAMADGVPVGQWLGTLVQREADRRAHEAERQRAYRARRRQQGAGDAG